MIRFINSFSKGLALGFIISVIYYLKFKTYNRGYILFAIVFALIYAFIKKKESFYKKS